MEAGEFWHLIESSEVLAEASECRARLARMDSGLGDGGAARSLARSLSDPDTRGPERDLSGDAEVGRRLLRLWERRAGELEQAQTDNLTSTLPPRLIIATHARSQPDALSLISARLRM